MWVALPEYRFDSIRISLIQSKQEIVLLSALRQRVDRMPKTRLHMFLRLDKSGKLYPVRREQPRQAPAILSRPVYIQLFPPRAQKSIMSRSFFAL